MKDLLNTIKKCCVVVVLFITTNVLFLTPNIKAQDDEFENYAFDDNKKEKHPYFALSFGVNANFLFMNYDEINKKFSCENELCDKCDNLSFSGPIVGAELNFFTAMSPFINNARLGISYFWGIQEIEYKEAIPTPLSGVEEAGFIYNNRELSVSNCGIHFDYAIVPFKSLAILPGVGLKFGSMTLEHFETTLPENWNNNYVSSIGEKLEYSYVSVEPQMSIEYAITGFLMLRAAGRYVFSFDSPFVSNVWTINGDNPYSGVPKSVKPQGFSASIGLYLGLFNY